MRLLWIFVAAVAFVSRPQKPVDPDYLHGLLRIYQRNRDISVKSSLQIYDKLLFMWANLGDRYYFIGAFGNWFPVPDRFIVASQSLDTKILGRCNYRGINLGGDCLCFPSWQSSSGCTKRIPRTLPISRYAWFRSFEASRPGKMLFPALVGELSLLELIVFLMLTLYWLWYRYGHSHYQTLYRYTSLNGRSFALPALVLSHFSHPSTLHLLWGLYGVWTTMANMYSNVGGRLFWPTLVFAISVQSLFKVGYDLLVRRGSRVTATYGLQQLLVFSNIVSMMVYHTGGRNAMHQGQLFSRLIKNRGSLADFNLLGIEFLRAQVQLLLVEGIFSENS